MNIKFEVFTEKFRADTTMQAIEFFRDEPDIVLDFFIREVKPNEFKDFYGLYKRLYDLGYNGFTFLENLSKDDLTEILKLLQLPSVDRIKRCIIYFKMYAKFCGYNNSVKIMNSYEYVESVKPIYISHEKLTRDLREVDRSDLLNAFYYTTLARAIYYGIWSKDYTVLKNLRARDIDDKTGEIKLRDDNGHEWKITIPRSLAYDLIDLSEDTKWDKLNKSGLISANDLDCTVEDKVFKSIAYGKYKGSDTEGFVNSYRLKLRHLFKDVLEYNITPQNLFFSGMFYHMDEELRTINSDLQTICNKQFSEVTTAENEIITRVMDKYRIYQKPLVWIRNRLQGHLGELFGG
jgi:hypothetical protein